MDNNKKEIERIFRESNSPNDLFDAFHYALTQKSFDIETYKILLANPALSKDELKLFTEKLCSVMRDKSYELYSWSASILENKTADYSFIEDALNYYIKAAQTNPESHEPYIQMTRLFNYDIKFPTNTIIINSINDGLNQVRHKSKVYDALANIYKRLGNDAAVLKYKELAEKSSRSENQ